MPLQDLIGLSQTNSASALLGSEVKLEDLLLHVFGNADSGIADLGHHNAFFTPGADGESAALGHRLHAIDHNIQDGLLHEIGIYFDWQGLRGHIFFQRIAPQLGYGWD